MVTTRAGFWPETAARPRRFKSLLRREFDLGSFREHRRFVLPLEFAVDSD
jgi:hypothetical protein